MCNSLEQQIATARRIFAKMPDSLFDSYIIPLIRSIGFWPYTTSNDATLGNAWERLFYVVSLHEHASCTWRLARIRPTWNDVTPQAQRDIQGLLSNYTGTALRIVPGYDYDYCQRSTAYHINLLKKNKTYDLPVVLYPMAGKYHILDGYHRIAAFLCVPDECKVDIPAWVAEV